MKEIVFASSVICCDPHHTVGCGGWLPIWHIAFYGNKNSPIMWKLSRTNR